MALTEVCLHWAPSVVLNEGLGQGLTSKQRSNGVACGTGQIKHCRSAFDRSPDPVSFSRISTYVVKLLQGNPGHSGSAPTLQLSCSKSLIHDCAEELDLYDFYACWGIRPAYPE